jgi:2Fe-2S ferredoxin
MEKLPDRDQAELMLLQYAEHYDPERSRLSCQLAIGPHLDGMPLVIAPEE